MTLSIDLGSGPNPRNNFNCDEVVGIDTFEQKTPKVINHDLESGSLPFEDSCADFVLAFDCLEHVSRIGYRLHGNSIKSLELQRYNPFLDLMSDIWRVLKPGGRLYAMTPVHPNVNEVYRDPTHVNPFTPDMINYFVSNVGDHSMLPLTQHYGFKGEFHKLDQRLEGAHVIWDLAAVK